MDRPPDGGQGLLEIKHRAEIAHVEPAAAGFASLKNLSVPHRAVTTP
jgi:hypothetical protein